MQGRCLLRHCRARSVVTIEHATIPTISNSCHASVLLGRPSRDWSCGEDMERPAFLRAMPPTNGSLLARLLYRSAMNSQSSHRQQPVGAPPLPWKEGLAAQLDWEATASALGRSTFNRRISKNL